MGPRLEALDPLLHGDEHAIGGEDRFRKLSNTARDAGLGVVLDIVPNHMAADESNPWWTDRKTRAEIFDYDPETGWYRRFFDVDGLAGVRQEDPSVFERTHAKVFELLESGLIDGLRIEPRLTAVHVHPVTCSLGVPTRHLDLQFVAHAPAGAQIEISDESEDLRWWPADTLPEGTDHALAYLVAQATRT